MAHNRCLVDSELHLLLVLPQLELVKLFVQAFSFLCEYKLNDSLSFVELLLELHCFKV